MGPLTRENLSVLLAMLCVMRDTTQAALDGCEASLDCILEHYGDHGQAGSPLGKAVHNLAIAVQQDDEADVAANIAIEEEHKRYLFGLDFGHGG